MKKQLFWLLALSAMVLHYSGYSSQAEPEPGNSSEKPTISADQQEPSRIVESNGTTVILPASYNKQKTYPAMVLLPFTGGTASDFFERRFEKFYRERKANPFIIILPAGRGSTNDYSTGNAFSATIQRYENHIKSDLKVLIPKYNIDASRVSLSGYSLGADLGWALSLRNPDLFRGAVLIDSICGYRLASNMNRLAKKGFRAFLIAGQKEANERNHPMYEVKALLDRNKIFNVYKEFPNSDHYAVVKTIPLEMFMQSVDYSLALR